MNTSINKNEFASNCRRCSPITAPGMTPITSRLLPRRHAGWVSQLIAAPVRIVTRMARRHRVMNELGRLSDRELSDLGISRSDITRVFSPEFAAEYADRGI